MQLPSINTAIDEAMKSALAIDKIVQIYYVVDEISKILSQVFCWFLIK
jgi:hypothetical protein